MKKIVEVFTFKLAVGNTEEAFKAAGEKLNEWLTVLEEHFTPTAGISMAHFFKSVLGMRDFG